MSYGIFFRNFIPGVFGIIPGSFLKKFRGIFRGKFWQIFFRNITGHRRGFPHDIIHFLPLKNPGGTCAPRLSYHGSSPEAGTGPVPVSRPFSIEKTVSKTVSDSGIIYGVIPYIISDFISGNCACADPRTYARTCMHGLLFPAGFSNRRDGVERRLRYLGLITSVYRTYVNEDDLHPDQKVPSGPSG